MIYDVLYHVFVVLSSMVVGAGIYHFGSKSSTLIKSTSQSPIPKKQLKRSKLSDSDKGGDPVIDWGLNT